jgi:hypothetical protein
MRPASRTVAARRLAMVTPGDWIVLPLDPRTRDRRIARLVEREVGKEDRVAWLRRQTIVELRKVAADAHRRGAFFAAVSSRIAGDRPMAASVLALMMSPADDREAELLHDPDALALVLDAQEPGAETLERSTVDLQLGRAIRLRRRVGTGIHDQEGRQAQAENVQFFVPLPEADRLLALVFSTPILPLADAYAEVFDAMAMSGSWIAAPPAGGAGR